MNILRVGARNFRSYAELDITLPDGCTAIIGPNGAGKSTILAAIDVALFGARSLEPYLRHGAERLVVGVEVEHEGKVYSVGREFSAGRSVLGFEEILAVGRAPLTLETQAATQKRIEETLGLNRPTFRASAYLAQGDAGAITNARPAERMAILRDTIGGLDIYETAHAHAKSHMAAVTRDLAGTARIVEQLESDLLALPAAEQHARDLEQIVEHQAHKVRQSEEALKPIRQELDEAQQRRAAALAVREERAAVVEEILARHREQVNAVRLEHAGRVQRRREALAAVDDLEHEAARYNAEAEMLRRTAEVDADAGPGEITCTECGQLLGVEALAKSIAYRRETANDRAARAHDLLQRAANVEVPAEPDPYELPETPELPDDLGPVSDFGVPVLQKRLERAERHVWERREHFEAKRREQAVNDETLKRLRATESTLLEHLEREKALGREEDVLSLVVEMFSPTGIPLLVTENAVPLVEHRAQEVLERLGGETAGCSVELQTQRQLKTSDALRDTLDILIHTAGGETRPYEHWSGGEKMRLDLAIRVGLAQLLLAQGANVEMFAVDEPDGLDVQGRAALVDVITEMGARYGFRKVFLISHDEELRDALPQTLEVVRPDGGPSQVAA